jgi:hypothetical protein
MNFKKIIAAVAAGALALSLFAVSASAESATLQGSIQDAEVGWAVVSEQVELNGDGDYTITIKPDTGYTQWGKFTFEVPTGGSTPASYANAYVTFNSVTVNGDTKLPLDAAVYPLCDENGAININLFNVWHVPALGYVLDTSEANAVWTANSYAKFLDASGAPISITEWTVDFTISMDGAPAGAATTSPSTGNVPVIALGAAMALAVAGAVISRKRK